MAYISLSFLGPFQAWSDHGAVSGFRTVKERALLAYLLIENDHPLRRDMLAELFWPGRPEGTGRNNLRQALYGVRSVLNQAGVSSLLNVKTEEIQFLVGRHNEQIWRNQIWVDVFAFKYFQEFADSHFHNREEPCSYCMEHWKQAVEIYRGEFLEDIFVDDSQEFQEWLIIRREQYFKQQLQVLQHLADAYHQMGDYSQAAVYALQQVKMDPLQENLHRQAMLLLAKAGRLGEALERYELCREELRANLGIEPDDTTTALYEEIRSGSYDAWKGQQPASSHNLPVFLTPFIGREMELSQIAGLLRNPDCRLVSLVGPGGVGKTRLAVEAAQANLQLFPDGVHFIALDSLRSADFLPEMVAEMIGLVSGSDEDISDRLFDFLRNKHLLLVMDNFEHLLAGSRLVIEILKAAPFVKIIVTSRERLHFQAEFLIDLTGLPFPRLEEAVSEDHPALNKYEAVRLFLERAGRVRADCVNNQDDLQAAGQICKLMEGLPLGIELAASWVRDFSLPDLAREVQHSLAFLQTSLRDIPERHRSLWASFEHSWSLLSLPERDVFARLSVFTGSFSVAAAQAITGAAFPWIIRLLDQSLLRRVDAGRYELHPLLRQYAGQKLADMGSTREETYRHHAAYFARFLNQRAVGMMGGRQAEYLNDVEVELDNVRAAWDWAVNQCDTQLLGLAANGWFFFFESRSRWEESKNHFSAAVNSLQCAELDRDGKLALAVCTLRLGLFYCRLTQFERARDLLEESRRMLTDLQAEGEKVLLYLGLAFLNLWLSQFDEAWQNLEACQEIAAAHGNLWGKAWAQELQAEIAFESSQTGMSETPFLGTLAMFKQNGDLRGQARAQNFLGNIAIVQNRCEAAREFFEHMLSNLEQIGDVWGIAAGYNKLGQLMCVQGNYRQAQQFFERGLHLLEKSGDRRRIALANRDLGETLMAQGDAVRGKHHLRLALQICREVGSIPLALDVLTGWIVIFMKGGEYKRAFDLAHCVLSTPGGDRLTRHRAKSLVERAEEQVAAHSSLPDSDPLPIWGWVEALLTTSD